MEKKEKGNFKNFKVIWNYLKQDRLTLIIYLILEIICALPPAITPFVWGLALEKLVLKDFKLFFIFLISYEAIWMIMCIFMIPRERLYNYLEVKFTKNITKDLYQKIDCLPAIAFEDIGVGEFVNRLYTDPDKIMSLLNSLIKLLIKSLIAIFAIVLAFKISIILGIEVIIFSIIMGLLANKYFPKIKNVQKEIKKESDLYVKYATENITGMREIKSLGIKKNIEKKLFKNIDTLFDNNRKCNKNEVIYYSFNSLLYYLLQFVILLTCGYFFIKGNIVYSVFIMMEMYLWRIDYVVESLSNFGVNFNKVSVSLGRINDILSNRLYQDEKFGNLNLKDTQGIIEFKNVKFKYREEEDYTLNGFNLKIEPHKKIAIVGRSGNGKSTIFNLLLRYFDATEGEVLIDYKNIQDLTEESLRNNISIIRQSPFLFNLSIFDNFKIVKEDVTLEEIKDVCQKCYIDSYIESLPNKYDTIIGEGGINLSGGQKQRLAVARTLLLNTKIILFDEATSALDNESQEYIKKTIDDLVATHTIVIVAHRLSTIVDADTINVVDKGILVDSGTNQELLDRCKTYQDLYKIESSNQIME